MAGIHVLATDRSPRVKHMHVHRRIMTVGVTGVAGLASLLLQTSGVPKDGCRLSPQPWAPRDTQCLDFMSAHACGARHPFLPIQSRGTD